MTKRDPRGRRSTLTKRPRHTTVPSTLPPPSATRPKLAPRHEKPRPIARRAAWAATAAPKHRAARIIDPDDATLLDLIDNLLNQGVVLSAELILGLANVDLVYVRLSALLCAADRVLPPRKS